MVNCIVFGSIAILCSRVWGKEINMLGVASSNEYLSGAVHYKNMNMKMEAWKKEADAGLLDSALYPEVGYTKCENGFAAAMPGDDNNTFRCRNIDLYHFLSHTALGSLGGRGSSSWGWTSATGREFIALGQTDGAAFVEITSAGKMKYLGRLPPYDGVGSIWREIRVVGDYAVIGSEAHLHGIQLFDMRKLLDLDPNRPRTFGREDLSSHWGVESQGNVSDAWDKLPAGRTHNIVVNTELNYAMAVGSIGFNPDNPSTERNNLPCNGGIIFLNITDPTNMHSTGCAAGDNYVHDAQCLVYRGPDKRYQGREICYAYAEDTITIFDVTNKIGNTTTIISRTSYEEAQFVHQGVVLDVNNQEYLIMDDEVDELVGLIEGDDARQHPTTRIFDIRDLENPKLTGFFRGKSPATDHNQYVYDGYVYQSNYGAGFNVWDIKSIPKDPTGASVCEAGFFDVYPEDDEFPGGGSVFPYGSWSSFAGFKSGYIFVNTIARGAFVVKMSSKACSKAPICNADNCLRAFRSNSVPGRLAESREFCGSFTARKRGVEAVTEDFAKVSCTRDLVAQVSSACACLPTATVL